MSDRGDLVRALEQRGVADWVIVQRDQQLASIDEAVLGRARREQRTRWTLLVHDDGPTGRGTARLELGSLDGDAGRLVEQTIALARAAVGAPWTSPAVAAPAKVAMLDPALERQDDLADAGARLLAAIRRPSGVVATASIGIAREHVAIETRQGFKTHWDASTVRADLLVIAGAHSLDVHRDARRLGDLELDDALATAAGDALLLATAGAPVLGPCAVRLGADALLAGGGLGLWAVFAAQADGVVERQGLTRYRPGAPIAPGAELVAEPLTIVSDGALDFGLASAPLGDGADAVRRFTLVDRGVAADLGLSPREAALRRRDPNGGVRNLVVTAGTWSGEPTVADATTRVIDVRRIRSVSIDPYTGDASLEVGLAIEHTGSGSRAFVGGTLRLDLIVALAHARRSARVIRRGAYVGPDAVLVDRADLIA